MCDEDATAELRVKTVKYFKGLMQTREEFTIPENGKKRKLEE